VRVDREPPFAELAVVDDVDAKLHLFPYNVVDGMPERLLELGPIDGLALIFRLHCLDQFPRPRQTSRVRDENSLSAAKHPLAPLQSRLAVLKDQHAGLMGRVVPWSFHCIGLNL
jgi:hypothetical protein